MSGSSLHGAPPPGFTFDPASGCWFADGFAGLKYADGGEASLERLFRASDSISDYPVDFAGAIVDWPTRYHLSHLRVNFLEALKTLIEPSWMVLELGGGLGAITKWLAQVAAGVDVLEGSHERARVNRLRTRDDSNVRILVGDMVEAPLPMTYDLATLIGVLEYTPAREGVSQRAACLDLLRKVRAALSDDGVVMVAIENRLGAKYWAGCGEDHSELLFDGLLAYPDRGPTTFSRNELEGLLAEAGFVHQQFYHVHPDYKLPTVVIREVEGGSPVRFHQWMSGLAEDYERPREYLMPDQVLLGSLEEAGLLWQFSNSFVVLCSPSADTDVQSDWIAKKLSNDTRPELHHTVTLSDCSGKLKVERRPLRGGRDRVEFGEYTFALSDGDYVPGSLLSVEASRALMSKDWLSRLSALSREILESARAASREAGTRSADLLDGGLLDYTMWNLVRTADGSIVCIDRKWRSKAPVAPDYLIFRSLYHLLGRHAPFVETDVRVAIRTITNTVCPGFDDARLDACLAAEASFQKAALGERPGVLQLTESGRLPIPQPGSHLGVLLRERRMEDASAWLLWTHPRARRLVSRVHASVGLARRLVKRVMSRSRGNGRRTK